MKKTALVLTSVICFGCSTAVWASEPNFRLDEILVTATKSSVNVKDLPHDVSVITKEDFAIKNAQSLKDVLDSLPGVAISRSGGRRSVNIRGFDSRYVTILVDGQRLPSEPDATYELDRIALDNVERIEIVRGSGSALYGADALGGVVNVITKQSERQGLKLALNKNLLTSHGDQSDNYSVNYDSGKQDKFRYTLTFKQDKNDAWYKSNNTTYYPFGTRNYAAARFEYQPNDEEKWLLDASYVKEKTDEYSTFLGVNNYLMQTNLKENNERQNYKLSYQKDKDEQETLVNVYRTVWEKYNDTINRKNGLYTANVYGYTTNSGIEARQSVAINEKHKLTVGGEYRYELYRGTGIDTGEGVFSKVLKGKMVAGSETTTSYGAVYLQDEWRFSPKLFLVNALRFDDSNKFRSDLNPKLGLTYSAADDLRLKFNAGTGFRVPSPNQMYLNLNVVRNGSMVNLRGNSNLDPEESSFYDFSVEKDWHHTSGKATYFYSKIKDMIDEVWQNSNTIQYENIKEAEIQGIELSTDSDLGGKLSWNNNYTYIDAVNSSTGKRLYNRARHKISSYLNYSPEKGLKLQLGVDAYRSYYFQPSAAVIKDDNYALCNFAITKDLDARQKIMLGVDNIFNQKNDDLSLPGTVIRMGYQVEI
ncbi:MAG: TonB-dependent receptor [Negativicutes bacterium]|nr:TonB-dependent receptor [Negativicutes bacterium]